jgi:hypothetical protein
MTVSRALRRLLRVRELEEEQSRLALESALAELSRMEGVMAAAAERDRRGRRLVSSSAQSGELPDRLTGMEETRAATRLADVLSSRIEVAAAEAEALREVFLARRVERRQAETLIEENEAQDDQDAARRSQQALDDWHRSQVFRDRTKQQYSANRSGSSK